MTDTSLDDDDETASFRIADQKIGNLLKRLSAKGVCPHCAARALAYRAAYLAEDEMGSIKAIELFEYIIDVLRESDIPPPARSPSSEMH